MKLTGAHKATVIASVAIALVLAGSVAWLLNKPATGDCGAGAPADHNEHEISPIKVVVQPWLGPHHVYGVFVVPNRYKPDKGDAVALSVRGFDHHFAIDGRSAKQDVDHVCAPSGHYLLRSYLPTRVALWFLFTGHFGNLRRPCDWRLVFSERSL